MRRLHHAAFVFLDQSEFDQFQKWNGALAEKAAKALSHVAMTDVATIPVGQWYGKTAFRRSITGVLQGVSPYPWNVRPA